MKFDGGSVKNHPQLDPEYHRLQLFTSPHGLSLGVPLMACLWAFQRWKSKCQKYETDTASRAERLSKCQRHSCVQMADWHQFRLPLPCKALDTQLNAVQT